MTAKLFSTTLAGAGLAFAMGTTMLATPAMAETLKMAWSQDATGLDPHKQTAFSSLRLLELLYEPLVRLDANLEVTPAIAASWEFNDDATQITFHLDPDARFQNGAAVTSADVKASFERILNEETGAAARANFASITGIDTPDAETVVFTMDGPNVPILSAMTSANASVVPAAEIEAGTIGTEAVGSGPFVLAEWVPNSKVTLTTNPDWAGGTVSYDGIDINVLPDETAILAALRSGQVDFALLNDPLIATLVPNEASLTLNKEPVLAYHVLQLNPARGAMAELGVRQAISCAVDRQEVLDTALLGEGRVTGPLTMPAYRTDPSALFCYERDVEKAKALMAETGYADGFSATVMAATGEPPTAAAEAQVLQSQLAEIGIDLTIEMMELNVYVDAWLKGDFDMAVALNGGRDDPYTMYNRYWTKAGNLQHVANYIDDELDSLMLEGRVETDLAKRKEIFAQFEQHLAEASPWVWLYTGYNYTAQQNYISGFAPNAMGSLFGLTSVSIDK
ncbi:ABC transporter substrate-binding protein [Sinisalibacter aestuarii]|uniref:ABC transporter substrate-binding protein n=1 Tax=Sinisalibacter aestuarii TaxID=2949426 RepID=A0ABQ5LU15_9RHOB|nr:ABC transporter substrate-binding protein [Sinisalibacter aestuarii]GKY88469.1 ABC transporter substrate-binding protein [Sinisalibacter aestuarii]